MNMSEQRGNVWVFVEQEGGKVASVSLQLISKGRELADRLGVKLEAIFLGDKLEGAVAELFHYGCDKVFLAEDPRLEPFTVLPYAKVIMDLIRAHKPNILLFGATLKGRELAPRVASEKLAGLTADCTDLQIDDFEDKKNNKSYTDKLMQIRPASFFLMLTAGLLAGIPAGIWTRHLTEDRTYRAGIFAVVLLALILAAECGVLYACGRLPVWYPSLRNLVGGIIPAYILAIWDRSV